MSVQFSKDDFEKLVWDSRLDSTTKLVALALKWHINNKSNEAFVGVKRLSYMVGRDERTIRRCLSNCSPPWRASCARDNGSGHID